MGKMNQKKKNIDKIKDGETFELVYYIGLGKGERSEH